MLCCCNRRRHFSDDRTPFLAKEKEPDTLTHVDGSYNRKQTKLSQSSQGDDRESTAAQHQDARRERMTSASRRSELHDRIKATLGSGKVDVRDVVKLPPGEDVHEWLAVHCIDFHHEIAVLYGTLQTELCTPHTCPVMSAGPKYTYLWADGQHIKTPIRVPAPEYIEYLMEWVDNQLANEDIFPVTVEQSFPADFMQQVKVIFKRLFRVYGHMYHSHFTQFVNLGASKHLNTCFKRFAFFILEFELISHREMAPLQQLISSLLDEPNNNSTTAWGA